ncbi:MazG family protein, partial [mine drainage metagenome]
MSIADLLVGADKAYSMTYLYHLGLDDELVREIGLAEVSSLPFDHLTSLLLNDFTESSASAFTSLLEIVRELRVKCPWDANQDHQSLSKHLVEEAYEVVDAIDKFYSETSNSGALGDEFLSDHQIY